MRPLVGFTRQNVATEVGEKWARFIDRAVKSEFFVRTCPRQSRGEEPSGTRVEERGG